MMFYPLSIALLPLLLLQGRRVRRSVPRLPEPPGEREGVAGSGPPLRLLIVGDSSAAGVGADHQDEALLGRLLAELEPHYSVRYALLATSGHKTIDALRRLGNLAPRAFDVAVTSLGVNDVIAMASLRRWLNRQARLRALLRERFGVSRLIVSGLPPMHEFPALPQPLRWHFGTRATRFDVALAADVAREGDVEFVDLRFGADVSGMSLDGFHPGPAIYAEWARRVAAVIRNNRV